MYTLCYQSLITCYCVLLNLFFIVTYYYFFLKCVYLTYLLIFALSTYALFTVSFYMNEKNDMGRNLRRDFRTTCTILTNIPLQDDNLKFAHLKIIVSSEYV